MNVGKKWRVAAAVITAGSWVGVDGARVKNLWQRMRGQTQRARQDVVTTMEQDTTVVKAKTVFTASSNLVPDLIVTMKTALNGINGRRDEVLTDIVDWNVEKLDDHLNSSGPLRSFTTVMANALKLKSYANAGNCSKECLAAIEELHAFYVEHGRTLNSINSGSTSLDAPSDHKRQAYVVLVREGLKLMRAVVLSTDQQ